jgi:predicted ester cyclase
MSAKNVKTRRAAHESWNKRDFAGVASNAVNGLAYTDHGRNITLNTRDKFREWTEGWAKAFSGGRITNSQYIDAGDIVVAQFTAEGTNDGPLGSLKPTGQKCLWHSVKSVTSTRMGGWFRAAATTINTHF